MIRACPSAHDFLVNSKELDYKVFAENPTKPYNLNVVGWRNKEAAPFTFEDWLAVYYEDSNIWFRKAWPITTKPGKPWLLNPCNPKGAAILAPGQYLDAYHLGQFKGCSALKQAKPVRVYRDANRDSEFDLIPGTVEEGLYGIHIHRGGVWNKSVGRSSAGCQVFQKALDFFEFILLVKRGEAVWGNSFTYTLMEF